MKIYFVRHAQTDFTVHQDDIRPLTEKGWQDSKEVTAFLAEKNITAIYSSPYQRCIDTLKDFSEFVQLPIEIIYDLRERSVGTWVEDFRAFAAMQWQDYEYKLEGGDSLAETQSRNVSALQGILQNHTDDESLAIGTHGTALSTIIRYYRPSYGLEDFLRIEKIMPLIVVFEFEGTSLQNIAEITL